jgi:cyclopropane-fatty-acyl-phospholipid synthase
MSGKGPKGVELSGDIEFIKTPAAKAPAFGTGEDCGINLSNVGS